jgi:hypothetical protein
MVRKQQLLEMGALTGQVCLLNRVEHFWTHGTFSNA